MSVEEENTSQDKEDDFFVELQTNRKNIVISGANSWNSSSINGI
jgi:hypothetical protein